MDTPSLYQPQKIRRVKRQLKKKQLPDFPARPAENRISIFLDYRKFLVTEANALLTRLGEVRAFSLKIPMAPAANIPLPAQKAIHHLIREGVMEMKAKVILFIRWLQDEHSLNPEWAQKQYALLKLKFNWLLDQVDIFADVLSQRAEHGTGIALAGMDALAEDTLRLRGNFYESPPLITYLDRGHGAAIRRARTRLPGGKSNPVAVIRVPRERMISTGIASSLVHEVGHQGASLLGLIPSLRHQLLEQARSDPENAEQWNWYERWISEILADLWSVAMVGIGSTTGLMNVVSVPSYFVFRLKVDDPHPPPWIRVRLSIAFGAALFPDRQWERLTRLWGKLYPLHLAGQAKVNSYQKLEALIPAFVQQVINHRPASMKGRTLRQGFPLGARQPNRLRQLQRQWNGLPERMLTAPPSLVFAVIGQARADGLMTPGQENALLGKMLRAWALKKII
jgi:hypothetical protein